jgi:hypothetical protein
LFKTASMKMLPFLIMLFSESRWCSRAQFLLVERIRKLLVQSEKNFWKSLVPVLKGFWKTIFRWFLHHVSSGLLKPIYMVTSCFQKIVCDCMSSFRKIWRICKLFIRAVMNTIFKYIRNFKVNNLKTISQSYCKYFKDLIV